MSGQATGTIRVRSLPLNDWPGADRLGWTAVCKPGQRLCRGGSASHLARVTQEDLARRYGYFLDFLDRFGRLDRAAEAAAQLTPEAIAAFIAELQARVSSVTVARTTYKVRRAAECIAPNRDFAWLAEIEKDLALLERPKSDFDRIVLTERLVEAGLTLLHEAEADTNGPWLSRALLVRNGLMVALLAFCPIRLKNFAALEIGRSFLRLEGGWWIVLDDTKSRRPDHRPVPSFLTDHIESYLEIYRPVLLRQATPRNDATDLRHGAAPSTIVPPNEPACALWLGRRGNPLCYSQVKRAITETTRMTLGVPVNPHRFRTSDATSAALHASHAPHLASALLQHSDSKVTEEHYNRASSLSVARDFAKLITKLRLRDSTCSDTHDNSRKQINSNS
jgi:integrase